MSSAKEDRQELTLKILVTADRLAGRQLELVEKIKELAEMFAFLLDKTSLKLTEKQIHEMIDEWEREERRRKKVNIGVPRKVLNL